MYYRRRCFADYFLLRTEEVCILRKLMLSGSRRFGVLLSHVLYSSLDAGGWHLPWMKWIMMMVLIFSLGWLTPVRPRPFSSWSPFQKKNQFSSFLIFMSDILRIGHNDICFLRGMHCDLPPLRRTFSIWSVIIFSLAECSLQLERFFSPLGAIFSPLGAVFFLHGGVFSPLGVVFPPLRSAFSVWSVIFSISECLIFAESGTHISKLLLK